MKQWSVEQRAAAAERARRNRPWTRSTGPVSAEGKRRSAQNSTQHGRYSRESRALNFYLRLAARTLKILAAKHAAKHATKMIAPNEQKLGNELSCDLKSQRAAIHHALTAVITAPIAIIQKSWAQKLGNELSCGPQLKTQREKIHALLIGIITSPLSIIQKLGNELSSGPDPPSIENTT